MPYFICLKKFQVVAFPQITSEYNHGTRTGEQANKSERHVYKAVILRAITNTVPTRRSHLRVFWKLNWNPLSSSIKQRLNRAGGLWLFWSPLDSSENSILIPRLDRLKNLKYTILLPTISTSSESSLYPNLFYSYNFAIAYWTLLGLSHSFTYVCFDVLFCPVNFISNLVGSHLPTHSIIVCVVYSS